MIAQARRQGIERLLLLTEVRLASHLSRLAVRVRRIGGAVEHRGSRVPSLIMVDEVIAGFGTFVRPLYRVIADEIDGVHRLNGV